MSTIGERIRNRREELHLSQEQVAKKLGYKSRSSINKIESDSRNLTRSRIKDIADVLLTTPEYIMGWSDDIAEKLLFENIYPIDTKKFPLLGTISCGEPIFAEENLELYVEAFTTMQADFCLRCKGDSMINARINDGDIVFIRKQPTVFNGEIAVVAIGDEATLKRVYHYREEGKLILQAENPKYAPLIYVGEEVNDILIL